MLLVLFKKFLGIKRHNHPLPENLETLENKVIRIQNGDSLLLNEVITDYQPYIAKEASRFTNRYIDPARDDEFAIALHAFHEALQKFVPETSKSFLSFASVVIRRRLIDHVRKEKNHAYQIPYSSFEQEDAEESSSHPIDVQQSIMAYEKTQANNERKAEIMELSVMLSKFGILFHDLVDASPKHVDSRLAMIRIGKTLSNDREMMEILMDRKTLPIKQLLENVDISRKTLERNRKYLIAIALILHGHYPYLSDYIQHDSV